MEKTSSSRQENSVYNPILTASTGTTNAAFAAALTAIGSVNTTLLLSPIDGAGALSTWVISANQTVPRNVTLRVPRGALLSVNTGVTLTLNGPVLADDPDWYSGLGTVTFATIPLGSEERYHTQFTVGYVISGGLHATSGSTTSATFACEAVTSDGRHFTQSAAAVTYSGGSGTYWLIGHKDTTTALTGWTRQSGTHYLWKIASTQPPLPSAAVLLLKVTIAASAVSAVSDYRQPASWVRAGVFDVRDPLYGALGDGTTDDTAAVQAALTAVGHQGGGEVLLPKGTYRTTAALTIASHTTLRGVGRKISVLFADHTGIGITAGGTVNAVVGKYITLKDCGIDKFTSASAGTGSGFMDLAGAFLRLENVFLRDCLYQVILDQSEHVEVHGCEFIGTTTATEVGIWLVNGPVHTATANPMYTNVITISDCQFNCVIGSATTHILDDGGVNHNILHNNFNAGSMGIRAASTENLRVAGNFFESQTTAPLRLAVTTLGGTTYFPNISPDVSDNAFSTTSGATYHVDLYSALNGSIRDNVFVFVAGNSAAFSLQTDTIQGVLVEGNSKLLYSGAADKPFSNATSVRLSAQRYRQRLFTSHVASQAAGAGVVLTPVQMGFVGTLERPIVGERLLVMDADQATSEQVVITGMNATTITVTLANSYAANFLLFALGDTRVDLPVPGTSVDFGAGTIANGATTVTITHQTLLGSHTASDIRITPTATSTNDVGPWWVDTVTATQFTVNVRNDPGASGFHFAWRVSAAHRY